MSHRSSRTPTSPSCHDEDEEDPEGQRPWGRMLDQIQREAEEELDNAGKILSAAGWSGMEDVDRASRNASRAHSRPETAPGTRKSSYRGSNVEEGEVGRSVHEERLSQWGSRGPSPEQGSRRVTRGHSPEYMSPARQGTMAFSEVRETSPLGVSHHSTRQQTPEHSHHSTRQQTPEYSHHSTRQQTPEYSHHSTRRQTSESSGTRGSSRYPFGVKQEPADELEPQNEMIVDEEEKRAQFLRAQLGSGAGSVTRGPSGVNSQGSCPMELPSFNASQTPIAHELSQDPYCQPLGERAGSAERGGAPSREASTAMASRIPSTISHHTSTPLKVPPEYGQYRSPSPGRPCASRPPLPRSPIHESPEKDYDGGDEALKQLTKFGHAGGPSGRCGVPKAGLDFSVCCRTATKTLDRSLPRKPDLTQDEIRQLIQCESRDVDSAWYLTSDYKKTYKKPCPKQQKAQMEVKNMVHSHAAPKSAAQVCGKEYSPMIEPDPEDISPEVAAAMMFSQEQGLKLEGCPNETIQHLFPDEVRGPQFEEKIPPGNISIVDQGQKDQEELIERSVGVPSEGISDSAYSRMKQRGEGAGSRQSYDLDFALGQDKREYVLVSQKPERFNKIQFRGNLPPWFPGYFSLFPGDPPGMNVVSSPSGLFHRAWTSTNPGKIPPSDVTVID